MTRSLTVDLASPALRALDIVILDDNDHDRKRMRRYLAQAGVDAHVVDCDSVEDFSAALSGAYFDAALIDYRLGHRDGIEAVNLLRTHRAQRQAAAIMVTGDRRVELAVEAIRGGCDDFVLKDALDPSALKSSLAKAMAHRRAGPRTTPRSPDTALALRDAVEEVASGMSAEVRGALNAAVARTRDLRADRKDDAPLLAALAHIDAACARIWTCVNGFERAMSSLDLARPKGPKLGLSKRRLH